MIRHVVLAGLLLSLPSYGFCDGDENTPPPQEVLDVLNALPDNTGPLNVSSSDTTADIVESGEDSVTGTQEGEITLMRTDSGIEVYSGLNKVEAITDGSDGWVGRVTDNTSSIEFVPTGRPLLHCPAQNISNWYGPCKVAESE